MQPVRDWDFYRSLIGSVRRSTPDFTSNLFASREQIERWCESDALHVVVGDRALLILVLDRDFYHVYHVAEDNASLSSALSRLAPGTYTTDIVGQAEQIRSVCAAYEAAGFAYHNFLVRMVGTQSPENPLRAKSEELAVEVVHPDQAGAVEAFLERLLDRFTEQLPTLDDVQQAARLGHVFAVSNDADFLGVLIYDRQGQSAHLRFWHVNPTAHGQGVGRILMAAFLEATSACKRRTLWVIGDNVRSIEIYRHYGFAEDRLLDRIMILNKVSN